MARLCSFSPILAFVVLFQTATAGPLAPLIALFAGTLPFFGAGIHVAISSKHIEQSKASVASVASVSSVSASLSSESHSSQTALLTSSEAEARASFDAAMAAAPVPTNVDPVYDVFTYVPPTQTATHAARLARGMLMDKRTLAANGTGWPIAPAGVPQFNFDDCTIDIRALISGGGQLSVTQPLGANDRSVLQLDNVPARCMVLANLMLSSAGSGPHPIPHGSSSLRWTGVTDQELADLQAWASGGTPPAT